MTNPSSLTLTANVWTKIATNVNKGQVWFLDSYSTYYHTYRDTGEAAPSGNPETGSVAFSLGAKRVKASNLGCGMPISTLVGSDIYIFCAGGAGRVIVEI